MQEKSWKELLTYILKIRTSYFESRFKMVIEFLGTSISKEDMKMYLDRLDLKTNIEGDTLVINVPTFRCV
jgi:phenylalanyl-tRNA synthetase beta chain